MNSTIKQATHLLEVLTPLGEDVLILTHFSGEEALSCPFNFALIVLSERLNIDAQTLIGQPVRVGIFDSRADKRRLFHGIISEFKKDNIVTANHIKLRRYYLNMVPWFACLNHAKDCRIFQQQSVKTIFNAICHDFGVHEFEFKLTKHYEPLDYCVQYNETHFDFLSRILEEAGIYYYFTHSTNNHTMVLVDDQSQLPLFAGTALLSNVHHTENHLYAWRESKAISPTMVSLNDYNYTHSQKNLNVQAPNIPLQTQNSTTKNIRQYRYPGKYQKEAKGKKIAQQHLEAMKWQANINEASSNYLAFSPGLIFRLNTDSAFRKAKEVGDFQILSVKHEAKDLTHISYHDTGYKEGGNNEPAQHYHNDLIVINQKFNYVPAQKTPKPRVEGLQNARVVGPKDNELYTDEYGRIKVHFYWDRYNPKNENASCWLRVAKSMAGNNWGSQFTPRVGAEVLVAFMGGDPDQPSVSATLYNGHNAPPFAKKEQQGISGFRAHTLGSSTITDAHELLFDDTPKKEKLVLSSQKDTNIKVLHDYTRTVNENETISVKADILTKVLSGSSEFNAKTMHLIVGNSSMVLDASGVSINASKIKLLSQGAGGERPVARVGDYHKCPKIGHSGGPILKGSSNVLVNGMPLARVSDPAHCRPGNDAISSGVDSIIVNGLAMASQKDSSSHGGVIKEGSPNVYVGESQNLLDTHAAAGHYAKGTNALTPHWIQGQYIGEDHKPMAGLAYKIKHISGRTVIGKLDDEGKTKRVEALSHGTAMISFGEREKLEVTLEKSRNKLKAYLEAILAKEKVQAEKDNTIISKEPWWDDIYIYSRGFVDGMAQGAVNVFNDTAHLAKVMFEEAGQALALSARIEKDTLTGNAKDLTSISHQATKKAEKIIQRIRGAIKTLKQLSKDSQTRQILYDFATKYYFQTSGLMLLKDVGNFIGGIIPALIIAVITKNPESFGPVIGAEIGGEVSGAAAEVKVIEGTLTELDKVREIPEAEVDRVHEIGGDLPPELGAQHKNDIYPLKGYRTPKDLEHPAGKAYNLPKKEAENFSGKPDSVMLPKGTKLYRIVSDKSIPNGKWWMKKLPKSKKNWRRGAAVIENWNGNGYYVEHTIEHNEGLPAWKGIASSQMVRDPAGNLLDGWIQKGGEEQIFIGSSQNDVPINIELRPTKDIGWDNDK